MVINSNRRLRILGFLAGLVGLLLTTGSLVFVFYYGANPLRMTFELVPLLGIGFLTCAYATFHELVWAIKGGPILRIDDRGIEDQIESFGVGEVLWSDVASVELSDYFNNLCLGFSLKDFDSIQKRIGKLRTRKLMRNLKQTGLPLYYHQLSLSIPVEELARNISRTAGIRLGIKNFDTRFLRPH